MHPSPCEIAIRTTSCVDHYKTKTKQEIHQKFLTLGILNDTTNIEDRNKLQNKGSKGMATTTQLYIAKMRFSQLAKKKT